MILQMWVWWTWRSSWIRFLLRGRMIRVLWGRLIFLGCRIILCWGLWLLLGSWWGIRILSRFRSSRCRLIVRSRLILRMRILIILDSNLFRGVILAVLWRSLSKFSSSNSRRVIGIWIIWKRFRRSLNSWRLLLISNKIIIYNNSSKNNNILSKKKKRRRGKKRMILLDWMICRIRGRRFLTWGRCWSLPRSTVWTIVRCLVTIMRMWIRCRVGSRLRRIRGSLVLVRTILLVFTSRFINNNNIIILLIKNSNLIIIIIIMRLVIRSCREWILNWSLRCLTRIKIGRVLSWIISISIIYRIISRIWSITMIILIIIMLIIVYSNSSSKINNIIVLLNRFRTMGVGSSLISRFRSSISSLSRFYSSRNKVIW